MTSLCGFEGIDLDVTIPDSYEILGGLAGDGILEAVGKAVAPGGSKRALYGPAAKTKPNPAVAKGRVVAKKAAVTARKAMQIAEAVARKAAGHKPAKPLTGKAVVVTKKPTVPGRRAVLGAVMPGKMTAKQKAAVAKHDKAGAKASSAARTALDKAKKAAESAKKLVAAVKKQKAASDKVHKRGARVRGVGTHIGVETVANVIEVAGLDPAEVLGLLAEEGVEIVGEGEESLDWGAESPADEGAETVATSGFTPFSTDPQAANSEPVRDMAAVGGIPYDGRFGTPVGSFGSYSYYWGTLNRDGRTYGFVFGGDSNNPEWPGREQTEWIWVHGKRGDSGSVPDFPGQERGVSGWWDNVRAINPGYVQSWAAINKASMSKGYGPIVGNPSKDFQGGKFAGLKVDGQGVIFWLPGDAPKWATAELDTAAALTAQAEAKARADAQAAVDAANAQAQAEADAEAARQAAAQALAEQAAASEAAIEEQRQVTQKQAQDLEEEKRQRELAAEQVRVDLEAQRAAIEAQRQQAQADAEYRQATAREDAQVPSYQQSYDPSPRQPYQRPQYAPPQPQYDGGYGDQPAEEYYEEEAAPAPAPEEEYYEEEPAASEWEE